MKSPFFVVGVVVCLLAGSLAWSQEARGTILGNVTDSSGAAIPAAPVTVTNKAMGTKLALTTNEAGV